VRTDLLTRSGFRIASEGWNKLGWLVVKLAILALSSQVATHWAERQIIRMPNLSIRRWRHLCFGNSVPLKCFPVLVAVSFGPATGMKPMNVDGLQVELVDGQITVTRPATNDTITYRRSADAPHLELAHSWIALIVTTPEISEFRTRAFQAAVDKARELGWIVC